MDWNSNRETSELGKVELSSPVSSECVFFLRFPIPYEAILSVLDDDEHGEAGFKYGTLVGFWRSLVPVMILALECLIQPASLFHRKLDLLLCPVNPSITCLWFSENKRAASRGQHGGLSARTIW